MQSVNLVLCFLLVLFFKGIGLPGGSSASRQEQETHKQKAASAQTQESAKSEAHSEDEEEEEPISEDLAPAAVQLDVSKDSPLIQKLYHATRETKEQEILARLAEAKALLDNGADVKAVDDKGRTALHWAVMGSS